MNWNQIIGQESLIKQLQASLAQGRVSHAQLFIGDFGYGSLALALSYINQIAQQENPNTGHKIENLNHVDLYFTFPVYSQGTDSGSDNFLAQWRQMILETPYATETDWLETIEAEKKLAQLSLSAYEGASKFLVIWQGEKMNVQAANKFLKFLEEPPANTYIFILVESEEYLLDTIISRCQKTYIKAIANANIEKALQQEGLAQNIIHKISHKAQGNWRKAQKLSHSRQLNPEFENYFIQWVRYAFQAKTKPHILKEIILWSREISAWSRPKQILFLQYASEIFRQALLQHIGNTQQVYEPLTENKFNWEAFSGYIHGANIEAILIEITQASYHIERNGNAKIVLLDMGIKLTRYLMR
jgi:DNA polymerase III subunit delta'